MEEKTVFGRRLPLFSTSPRRAALTGVVHYQLERRGNSNSWQPLEICLNALIWAACERQGRQGE